MIHCSVQGLIKFSFFFFFTILLVPEREKMGKIHSQKSIFLVLRVHVGFIYLCIAFAALSFPGSSSSAAFAGY